MFITSLQARKCTTIIYRRAIIYCSKASYCDKKITTYPDMKKTSSPTIEDHQKNKSVDEIEISAFENEEEIMELSEKERDASIRSRLSKECSTLLIDNKVGLSSSGLNVHMEQHSLKEIDWEHYPFTKTIATLKKQSASVETTDCIVAATSKVQSSSSSSSGSSNRIIRGEPGKVILGFVPEEWFKFFIPKTGVTGFFTFFFTFGTFLVSKEYYVLEHNYYGGLSMIILGYFSIKHIGPLLANFLDNEIDQYEKQWQKSRIDQKNSLDHQIEDELLVQYQAEGQMMLITAKRENVALQLEAEFRRRQMYAYDEVKKRLDYQVAVAMAHRRIIHKNLVEYVTREVQKSLTPDLQNQMLNVSIQNIIAEFEKTSEHK